jgi:hypothetical protein
VGWPFVATWPDGIRSRHGYSSFLSVNVAAAVAVFFQASAAAAVFVRSTQNPFFSSAKFQRKTNYRSLLGWWKSLDAISLCDSC